MTKIFAIFIFILTCIVPKYVFRVREEFVKTINCRISKYLQLM